MTAELPRDSGAGKKTLGQVSTTSVWFVTARPSSSHPYHQQMEKGKLPEQRSRNERTVTRKVVSGISGGISAVMIQHQTSPASVRCLPPYFGITQRESSVAHSSSMRDPWLSTVPFVCPVHWGEQSPRSKLLITGRTRVPASLEFA